VSEWLVVARREFIERVRTAWFVVVTVLGPVLMIGMLVVPAWLAVTTEERVIIQVVDQSGRNLAGSLATVESMIGPNVDLQFVSPNVDEAVLSARIRDQKINGFLVIPPDALRGGAVIYRGDNATNFQLNLVITHALNAAARRVRASDAGLSQDTIGKIELPPVKLIARHDTGRGEATSGQASFIVGVVVFFLLYMAILFYAVNVMRSVLLEKTSRVVEIVVSAIRPRSLMLGKVLGVGSVGLLQLAIWGAIALVLVSFRAQILGLFGITGSSATVPPLDAADVVVILAYFALGYFFYAAMYAAVGAMVNSDQEAQQLQTPIMLLLIMPALCIQLVANSPRGVVAQVLTQIADADADALPAGRRDLARDRGLAGHLAGQQRARGRRRRPHLPDRHPHVRQAPLAARGGALAPLLLTHRRRRRHAVAAVDDEDRAGDVVGRVAGQEHRQVGDLLHLAEAAQRDVLDHALADVAGREPAHALGVADRPRRDRHRAHAEAAPLDRERAGERVHAGLGRRRVYLERRAVVVERRADVEHEPAAAPAQRLERGLARVEAADQIDLDDGAKAVGRQRGGRGQEVAGRAVDQDVEAAHALDAGRHGGSQLVRLPHVGRRVHHLARRLGLELRCRCRQDIRLAAHQTDARAVRDVRARDALADACAAAGDERHAARQHIASEDARCHFVRIEKAGTAAKPRCLSRHVVTGAHGALGSVCPDPRLCGVGRRRRQASFGRALRALQPEDGRRAERRRPATRQPLRLRGHMLGPLGPGVRRREPEPVVVRAEPRARPGVDRARLGVGLRRRLGSGQRALVVRSGPRAVAADPRTEPANRPHRIPFEGEPDPPRVARP
jgi:ABC-2 type transport system permease protein